MENPFVQEKKIPAYVVDITMVMFMFEKSQAEVFMVAYSDYPAEMIQCLDPYQLLDSSKNGVLSNFCATEKNLKKFRIINFPAFSFDGKGTPFCTSYLVVLRNNRLYQAGIIKSGHCPQKKIKNHLWEALSLQIKFVYHRKKEHFCFVN